MLRGFILLAILALPAAALGEGLPIVTETVSTNDTHAAHQSTAPDDVSLLDTLTTHLDSEIQRAGGSLGGYTSASNAHSAMMGVPLQLSGEERVTPGGRCPSTAPIRRFDITAINIEITLNRFHHYFPGYLYVLTQNLKMIRAEERANAKARGRNGSGPPVLPSAGLQGDLIQPLAIRANAGDCVQITLRNQTENDEPISIHLHGASLLVRKTGQAATMVNEDSLVKPGADREFEWYIPPDSPDGAHPFHSHAVREQWSQGLFGALIVEPVGSRYFDPLTGHDLPSGWSAMIDNPNGPDFREFALWYHENGDKVFRINARKDGELADQRGAATDTYVPSHFAINLRNEDHDLRLSLEHARHGFHDESLGYSSYTFGDPASPIARSYLGDPVKYRVMGGSEVIHAHHLHGGSDRWPRSPGMVTQAEFNFSATRDGTGPVKFPTIRTSSERADVQPVGPTEAFTQAIECGSGGCAYGAGDFTFHCHIPQHYVGGMWGFWRVYNTLQGSGVQTDTMPPLVELPDRRGEMKPAVDSSALIGTTVDWFGGARYRVTGNRTDWSAKPPLVSVTDWVTMQMPTQGRPGGLEDETAQIAAYDASVFDWTWRGHVALNEPETNQAWENFESPTAGKRAAVLFDPATGKLALPWLRPHLGKRPPFAPDHNPAPYLEPIHLDTKGQRTTEPAQPGENGPWSLCPERAPRRFFTINAITLPITLKKSTPNSTAIVDPDGMIFVLEDEEAAVRADDDLKNPLIIRANVYDCVDVVFKSKLADDRRVANSSKVNMHPHLFQFDITGSDGVIVGGNYEQSVRPFTILSANNRDAMERGLPIPQNTTLRNPARAGDRSFTILATSRSIRIGTSDSGGTEMTIPLFQPGAVVGIGLDGVGTFEARRIRTIQGNEVTLTEPLSSDHPAGAIVSTEFVRYRWYPDVDLGIVFWHDHVFGLDSWAHGLFGSTVVEPPGSTYHDPTTGQEIRSGAIADIHTTEPVAANVKGSFREVVVHLMDSNPRTAELITTDNPMVSVRKGTVDGTPSARYPSQMNVHPMTFLSGGEASHGSGFGLRAEPWSMRLKNDSSTTHLFSSLVHGDPETPVVRAYLGDPVVFRLLQGATNEAQTWRLSGHGFALDRYNPYGRIRTSLHLAIADRFDLAVEAGGPQRMAGDYLFAAGRPSHAAEGSWGLLRVLDRMDPSLRTLPSRDAIPNSASSVCPSDAPVKQFAVSAIETPISFHHEAPEALEVDLGRLLRLRNSNGKVYALDQEERAIRRGLLKPQPLTLRANIGDCIKIRLTNRLDTDRVGFHVDGMAFDPLDSSGFNLGRNVEDQTIAPGNRRTYTFYAHPAFGENAALIQDWADPIMHQHDGLYGAILIGPRGSRYRDPDTGTDLTVGNSWQADVVVDRSIPENAGRSDYRDAALFFHDEDVHLGSSFMPYATKAAGLTAINYRASVPLDFALDNQNCSIGEYFRCVTDRGSVDTPIIQLAAGNPILVHVFGAFSEHVGVFSLDGHRWPIDSPGGSHLHAGVQFSGGSYLRVDLRDGDSMPTIPGDYLYMNHSSAFLDAGQWGLLRVRPGSPRVTTDSGLPIPARD